MGWFWKSSFEKNKSIQNRWLHERKAGQAMGKSVPEAEAYATKQLTETWNVAPGKLDKALSEGEKHKWGSRRLRDTDKK